MCTRFYEKSTFYRMKIMWKCSNEVILMSDYTKTTYENFTTFSDYVYFIIIQLHTKFYSVATNRFKVRNLSLHLILRKNQRFFGKVDENNGKMFE